jgi:2-haloacid dehalogenase
VTIDFDRFSVLTFDCYGTLIDWETGIINALEPALAEMGVKIGTEEMLTKYAEYESKLESGPFQPYTDVLRGVMSEFAREYQFELNDSLKDTLADSVGYWPPFDDTVESLKALHSKYKLAVVSNIDDDLFLKTARLLQVEFDYLVTARQVGAYKPDKRMFEKAIERIGLPRQEILHVAQSLFHDVAPAKELGLTTVWINRRAGRTGSGATPPAKATPDAEYPDLKSVATAVGALQE